jgi:nitroreductase
MELLGTLRSTGSVRAFEDRPVPDAVVDDVLDHARFAPSGGNRQPWRVAVVADQATRLRMQTMMRAVWTEYIEAIEAGRTPFAAGSTAAQPPAARRSRDNPLINAIPSAPVALVVAANLNDIALMDGDLARTPVTAGASIYPFCWSILLAARAFGLGGVLATFLSRTEAEAGPLLRLPPDHALAATIFLGYPVHQPTRLRRRPVDEFTFREHFAGEPFRTNALN